MCKQRLVYLLSLILMLAWAGSASADIELDSVSSAGAAGIELSWQHTIGSGDNRILVVGIAAEDGMLSQLVIDSITYGGAEMTLVEGSELIADTGYLLKMELYYLLAPAVGTDTITITYNGWITSISAGAISLTGVAQQAREAVATNWGELIDTISTEITTQTDRAWTIDIVGCNNKGFFEPTGIGMVEQFDALGATASGAGSTRLVASRGPTTLSWSHSAPDILAHSVAVFAAANPEPAKANGAHPLSDAVDVPPYTDLSWTPGAGADSHDIYFGTNLADVTNADNSWPIGTSVYKGNQPIDANSYEPGIFESKQTCYWRIDEVIDGDPCSPYKGYIWNFTVEKYTAGDFNSDRYVDIEDVNELAFEWLDSGRGLSADADGNGKVDFNDYVFLANNWLFSPSITLANECENWEQRHPEWIFCDDFESDLPLTGWKRYFEYSSDGGDFAPVEGVGVEGSKGMRVIFQPDEVSAGSLHLAFGRVPYGTFNRGIRNTEDFPEIYYRMYLKMQENWQGGDPAKLSRAFIFAGNYPSNRYTQAMIAHLWGGGANRLKLEPVSLVGPGCVVLSTTYNDFDHMTWLNKHEYGIGDPDGITPLFAPENGGRWYCIEAHVRLNSTDPEVASGLQEFWIDEQLEARRNRMNFVRCWDGYGINAVYFENYWNSGSPVTQERYFDNIVVSTEPIGCDCE